MPESRLDLSLRAVDLCIIAALLVGFSPVSLPTILTLPSTLATL